MSDSRGTPLGRYANHFEIGHNALEIVIDFGQSYEGDEAHCHTRIVTSPGYAQALLQLLAETLDEHRRRFGASRRE